jgi:microcystin degradation protein MlrC
MRTLMTMADALEDGERVGPISILQGYPWADSRYAGVSVIATAHHSAVGDLVPAVEALSGAYWGLRARFHNTVHLCRVDDALNWAARRLAGGQLTVLMDSGDNPTAGADTDDARLLTTLTAWGHPAVFGFIPDPLVIRRAVEAGVGGSVTERVGGRVSGRPEVSVPLRGTVLALGDDPEGGRTAAIRCGDLTVLVTERRMGARHVEDFTRLGVDPTSGASLLVVKSGYLFPDLTDMVARTEGAAACLMATTGASSLDLASFPYKKVERPIYPLDPETTGPGTILWRPPLPLGTLEAVD